MLKSTSEHPILWLHMAKNMSSTAYDWNGQPSSPTVPYATAVTSEPMHVNGNGNTSPPPPTVVSNLFTNGLLMQAYVKRVVCV